MRRGTTGPAPKFSEVHVCRAMFKIGCAQPIGRKRLARALGIGEGSTRSIIAMLQEEGLVRPKKLGMVLTARGKRALASTGVTLSSIEAGDMTIGPVDAAVHIRGGASKVRKGIEQRDEAIKAGAMGATTIVCRGGRLIALEDLDLDKEAKALARRIRDTFDVKDGDAVILSTAGDPDAAENGAVSAAMSMLDSLPF